MSKLIICTDGASKGNPGPAGIGVVISTDDGSILREIAEHIGNQTNNVAEYVALIKGLNCARELGGTELDIYVDSELMAKQLSGDYKVRSKNLQQLHGEALRLIHSFPRVRVFHVRREHNARADKLASQAAAKAVTPTLKRDTS